MLEVVGGAAGAVRPGCAQGRAGSSGSHRGERGPPLLRRSRTTSSGSSAEARPARRRRDRRALAPAAGDGVARFRERPYVGLVPYGEGDAAFFFGRRHETEVITANLRAPRLTILYGAERRRQELASCRPASCTTYASRRARRAAQRTQRCRSRSAHSASWHDEPLPPLAEAMRAAARRGARRQGASALAVRRVSRRRRSRDWTDGVRRRSSLSSTSSRSTSSTTRRGRRRGDGVRGRVPRAMVNEPNLRVNFVLSLREDALAKLDRFKGRIPAPVRELHPRRTPRPQGRTPSDRRARSAGGTSSCGPVKSTTTIEPALAEASDRAQRLAVGVELAEGGDVAPAGKRQTTGSRGALPPARARAALAGDASRPVRTRSTLARLRGARRRASRSSRTTCSRRSAS